jgi:esterase
MKLFYRKYGAGHPLIILHGLFGSSDNWASLAKKLSRSFMVIVPDQRNHGQSPHSHIHDYDSMKEDLAELVKELGLRKFILAGHSMGGKTAVKYALNWPEKLNGLIIADISPFKGTGNSNENLMVHRQILDFMINENISGIKTRNEIDSRLKETIKSERIRKLILKNLLREPDNTFSWKINAPAIKENLDKIAEGIEPGGKIPVEITGFPVIFMKGEHSDYLQENDYAEILRVFPGAEFIKIPHAGHWMHSDNPEAVMDCFMRLIQT